MTPTTHLFKTYMNLIERHHNDRLISIMDKHLPQWRLRRQELNAGPLAQEAWDY